MKAALFIRTVTVMTALAVMLGNALADEALIGTVTTTDGAPLVGANVFVVNSQLGGATDSTGKFVIPNIEPGRYTLSVSYVGYATAKKAIVVSEGGAEAHFVLDSDRIALNEIVITGVFNQDSKLNSSVAISTLSAKQIDHRNARGTGDLLAAVPGNFIDMSAGEVGAQVYPRGLSTGAVADIGFKYSSLQEDGLPLMSTQFQFAVIDMFHRADATVARLEAIRGGSASVSTANSPGGIFNFISKVGTPKFRGAAKVTSGIQGDGNGLVRTDVNLGGPLTNGWVYNLGGFFRHDEGARDLPFPANQGGQFKANVMKPHERGFIKFYGKALNDQVIFYKQLPVTDLDNPKAFPGFDLNTSTLIVDVENDIPSAADPGTTRHYDASDGVGVQNYGGGIQIFHELGKGWQLSNNLKYGYFEFDHFQSSGHNLLPIVTGPNRIHRLSNETFNSYTYRDAVTGELLARFENGVPAAENKIGDKVLLTLGKTVTYEVHDVIEQLRLSKTAGRHELTAGTYFGYSDIRNTLNLDFVLGRFEPNPRLISLTHPNPYADVAGQPAELEFTDPKGYFAYGFGTYTNFSGNSRIQAIFLNDVWQVNDKLNLDLGLRFEFSNHQGRKERWDTPAQRDSLTGFPLGQDGDPATFYDEFFKRGTDDFFDYDFDYAYWSGSLGLNYRIEENLAFYSRLTRGVKAPEMTYYINNFVNIDFEKGFEEEIIQGEAGVKVNSRRLSFLLTGFYSRLNNVPFQQLVVSGDIGQFTPATFNSTRTIGTEIEAVLRLNDQLNIDFIATVQDPKFVDFNYYNINRTGANFDDDFIEEFDGNTINEVPRFSLDVTPVYRTGRWSGFFNWRYIGERYANRRNTLEFPAFSRFDAGLSVQLSGYATVSMNVINMFNSAGLMNLEGVGLPGTTGEDVTPRLIETVVVPQNRPYFARPILPRSFAVTLSSNF